MLSLAALGILLHSGFIAGLSQHPLQQALVPDQDQTVKLWSLKNSRGKRPNGPNKQMKRLNKKALDREAGLLQSL